MNELLNEPFDHIRFQGMPPGTQPPFSTCLSKRASCLQQVVLPHLTKELWDAGVPVEGFPENASAEQEPA